MAHAGIPGISDVAESVGLYFDGAIEKGTKAAADEYEQKYIEDSDLFGKKPIDSTSPEVTKETNQAANNATKASGRGMASNILFGQTGGLMSAPPVARNVLLGA